MSSSSSWTPAGLRSPPMEATTTGGAMALHGHRLSSAKAHSIPFSCTGPCASDPDVNKINKNKPKKKGEGQGEKMKRTNMPKDEALATLKGEAARKEEEKRPFSSSWKAGVETRSPRPLCTSMGGPPEGGSDTQKGSKIGASTTPFQEKHTTSPPPPATTTTLPSTRMTNTSPSTTFACTSGIAHSLLGVSSIPVLIEKEKTERQLLSIAEAVKRHPWKGCSASLKELIPLEATCPSVPQDGDDLVVTAEEVDSHPAERTRTATTHPRSHHQKDPYHDHQGEEEAHEKEHAVAVEHSIEQRTPSTSGAVAGAKGTLLDDTGEEGLTEQQPQQQKKSGAAEELHGLGRQTFFEDLRESFGEEFYVSLFANRPPPPPLEVALGPSPLPAPRSMRGCGGGPGRGEEEEKKARESVGAGRVRGCHWGRQRGGGAFPNRNSTTGQDPFDTTEWERRRTEQPSPSSTKLLYCRCPRGGGYRTWSRQRRRRTDVTTTTCSGPHESHGVVPRPYPRMGEGGGGGGGEKEEEDPAPSLRTSEKTNPVTVPTKEGAARGVDHVPPPLLCSRSGRNGAAKGPRARRSSSSPASSSTHGCSLTLPPSRPTTTTTITTTTTTTRASTGGGATLPCRASPPSCSAPAPSVPSTTTTCSSSPKGAGGAAGVPPSPSSLASRWVVVDNPRTRSLLQARKYTRAYLSISVLLPQYTGDTEKTSLLLHRRGMCSFALMNYTECVQDFTHAFRYREATSSYGPPGGGGGGPCLRRGRRRRRGEGDGVGDGGKPQKELLHEEVDGEEGLPEEEEEEKTASPDGEEHAKAFGTFSGDVVHHVEEEDEEEEEEEMEMYRTWIYALIMREEYTAAERLYTQWLTVLRQRQEAPPRPASPVSPLLSTKEEKKKKANKTSPKNHHDEQEKAIKRPTTSIEARSPAMASTSTAETLSSETTKGKENQLMEKISSLEKECDALDAVKHFRRCVALEAWEDARGCLEAAKCVVEATPLRTIQALTYLEVGEVDLARETLLPYVPQIPPPLTAEAARNALPEERQLRCNVEAHYLLATALLAKASIYSGAPYMNIAASLTERCLRIHPCYTPALRIGQYLIALEDALAKVEQLCAETCFTAACDTLTEALELDPSNHRVCAMLYAKRGEMYLHLKKHCSAIEDCTKSLALDPHVAKTYLTRANALEAAESPTQAAADRSRAVELHPPYADVVREAQEKKAKKARQARAQQERAAAAEQRRRWEQQQQAQQQAQREQEARERQRWQAPPPPPPPPSSSSPSEKREREGEREEGKGKRPPRRSSPSSSASGATPWYASSSKGEAEHDQRPTSSRHAPPSAHGRRGVEPTPARTTLYDTLAVPMTATTEEIRRAFKRLTLQCHPDKMVNAPEEQQLEALELFKSINNAHLILSDPARRAEYDITILMEAT